MRRRWIGISLLLLVPLLLAERCEEPTLAEKERAFGPNPPRIVELYAQENMRFARHWLIFLNAEDPDGDMKLISALVRVSGGINEYADVGLREEFRSRLAGHIWLPIFPGQESLGSVIYVSFYIEDRAGHKTEERTLSLYMGGAPSRDELAKVREFKRKYPRVIGVLNVDISSSGGGNENGGGGGGGGAP